MKNRKMVVVLVVAMWLVSVVLMWAYTAQVYKAVDAETVLYAEIPVLTVSRVPSYNWHDDQVVPYHLSWRFVDPEGDSSQDMTVEDLNQVSKEIHDLLNDQEAKDRFPQFGFSLLAGDERSINCQHNRGHGVWYDDKKPLMPSLRTIQIVPAKREARVVFLQDLVPGQRELVAKGLVRLAHKMGMDKLEAGGWRATEKPHEYFLSFNIKK